MRIASHRRARRAFLALLSLGAFAAPLPLRAQRVSAPIASPSTKDLDAYIQHAVADWGIAGLAIAGAVIYLVVANTQASAAYYMTVKELRACTTCADRTVRVAGNVAPGTIKRDSSSETVRVSGGTREL